MQRPYCPEEKLLAVVVIVIYRVIQVPGPLGLITKQGLQLITFFSKARNLLRKILHGKERTFEETQKVF